MLHDDVEEIETTGDEADETVQAPVPPPDDAPPTPELIWQRTRQKSANRLAILPLAMGFIGLVQLAIGRRLCRWLRGNVGCINHHHYRCLGVDLFVPLFLPVAGVSVACSFLAIIIINWGGLLALSAIDEETFALEEFWPLSFAGIGAAFFITIFV